MFFEAVLLGGTLQDPTLCGIRSSPTSQVPGTYFMTGNYKLQINIMFQKLLDWGGGGKADTLRDLIEIKTPDIIFFS
jgi:hypothetical protein